MGTSNSAFVTVSSKPTNEVPVFDEKVQEGLGGKVVGLLEGLGVLLRTGKVDDLQDTAVLALWPPDRLVTLLDHV